MVHNKKSIFRSKSITRLSTGKLTNLTFLDISENDISQNVVDSLHNNCLQNLATLRL